MTTATPESPACKTARRYGKSWRPLGLPRNSVRSVEAHDADSEFITLVVVVDTPSIGDPIGITGSIRSDLLAESSTKIEPYVHKILEAALWHQYQVQHREARMLDSSLISNKMIPGPEATTGMGAGRVWAVCPKCEVAGRLGIELVGEEYGTYVDGCRCEPHWTHPLPRVLEANFIPVADPHA